MCLLLLHWKGVSGNLSFTREPSIECREYKCCACLTTALRESNDDADAMVGVALREFFVMPKNEVVKRARSIELEGSLAVGFFERLTFFFAFHFFFGSRSSLLFVAVLVSLLLNHSYSLYL